MAKAKEKPLQSMVAGTTKTPRAEKPTRKNNNGRRRKYHRVWRKLDQL